MNTIMRLFVFIFISMFFVSYANARDSCDEAGKLTQKELVQVLKDGGYGSPKIKSSFIIFKSNGMPIVLSDTGDASLLLSSMFSESLLTGSGKYKYINEWNRKRYSSRAYISKEGLVIIDSYLPIGNGLSECGIEAFINKFSKSVASFFVFLVKK